MDPDEALKRAREAAQRYKRNIPRDPPVAADDLADAFEAIDSWLSNGGFLPQDWQKK